MDYRQVLQTGTVLDGKYRIERVIGSGGFGITYEAFDIGLAAPVAIKEYYPSQFGVRDATYSVRPRSERDREIFDRLLSSFLREARTLNQFEHPAIVRVLSVFEAYGTAYMVMKYETGPSLKAWLADLVRLPTQSELDRLVPPLLDSLEMMHSADFLHRDIAPDNIIVRADGSPVLLDFGASRRVMGEMTGTLTGVVKKGYSPQEQYATDSRSQGPWTDIYALGATLYRCISGRDAPRGDRAHARRPDLACGRGGRGPLSPRIPGRHRCGHRAPPQAAAGVDRDLARDALRRNGGAARSAAIVADGRPGQMRPTMLLVEPKRGTGMRPGHPARSPDRVRDRSPRSAQRLIAPRTAIGASALAFSAVSGRAPADGESGAAPSQSVPAPRRRNMSAIAMVAGAVAIIGGGGLVLAMREGAADSRPGQQGAHRRHRASRGEEGGQ